MAWTITLHAERPESPRVGDMYPAPWLAHDGGASKLSPAYNNERRAHRLPLVVRLPGPVDFCIDTRAWRDGVPYGNGWTVTGEVPRVTLSPSVNVGGVYHGWIRDGVISDDCEGRTYDADGCVP